VQECSGGYSGSVQPRHTRSAWESGISSQCPLKACCCTPQAAGVQNQAQTAGRLLSFYTLSVNVQTTGPAAHGALLAQRQWSDGGLSGEDHAPAGVSAGAAEPPLRDPGHGLATVLASAS